ALTIRKFKKDKLTLDQLVKFGSVSPEGATILQIIGRVRCNVVVSGGTGSGKTTLGLALLRLVSSEGRIVVLGQDIAGRSGKSLRPLRRDMQVVFQDPYG
ncbi:Flp pilus assembly complex ATPase component TadA, partial [Mycobacterium tuberculosis]|nr:Flp pilus assembly complex ATPase component TadA [Mycobacterium tuberculosis]